MMEVFEKKKKSRIEILGEDQNKNLEKKIFLQIIVFFLEITSSIS